MRFLHSMHQMFRQLVPTRAILLLMAIGFVDLLSTAILHANGQIVELNPVMRPMIEHSEWLFAIVKGLTLVICWGTMVWYSKINLKFVKQACIYGSGAYAFIWVTWFTIGSLR